MKRRKLLIALVAFLAVGGVVAWQWERILYTYILYHVRTVTTSLPACDRVEVYKLSGTAFAQDPEKIPGPGEGFPIRAYGSAESKILARTTLSGADAEALATLWRAQTFDPGFQALCHSPAYGFRFYSGSKLTFETSLCYHCSNFYVTDMTGAGWWGFDSESPKANELLRRLEEIFPAPVADADAVSAR